MEDLDEFHTHDHTHGFTNGADDIEREHYEKYLTAGIAYESLNTRLAEIRHEIVDCKAIVATEMNVYERYQAAMQELQFRSQRVERCQKELAEVDQEERIHRQKVESYSIKALPVLGIVFVVAAVIFMAADFFISKKIVAKALSMDRGLESSLFAAGIAAISILLKPAYDALRANRANRKVTLWIIAAITIITVFVMGKFRYEAYVNDTNHEKISGQIVLLNDKLKNTTNFGEEQRLQQDKRDLIEEGAALDDKLNDHWSAEWFFVLTGILFAIAGAICFSEGVWILTMNHRRQKTRPFAPHYFADFKDYKTSRLQNLSEEQNRLKDSVTQIAVLKAELTRIQGLPPLIKELEEQKIALEKESVPLGINSRVAYYNDGYARGKQAEKTTISRPRPQAVPVVKQRVGAYKLLANSILEKFANDSGKPEPELEFDN